ncbi:DUF3383 family protein [Priestia megaterium]|uniref:DUF3383 family protein n=1 Tax=Priestia megaterium TaxID=1404 RepID=UPI003D02F8A8
MPLQDVTVSIELRKPSGLIGLGKPLILAEKAGASTFKTYSSIDTVKPDFAETTEVYKKADAIFAQDHRPATLAIVTYDPAATDTDPKTATEAIAKYYDHDWFFLLTADIELTDEVAIADYVEGKKFKMYVVKTTDAASRNAFKVKDYDYVIDFYHPTADEQADAVLVGELGSQDVGSISWKFKSLTGITVLDINADELAAIHEDGAIAYVKKAGINQTSEGITVSGEYIDVMHGKSWVKTNMENSVQFAFANNGKVSFDSRGIALFDSAATTVLQQAFAQGIIAADEDGNPIYTVTTVPRSETLPADRASRVYNGLSFSFELAGAIHSAEIKGEILV